MVDEKLLILRFKRGSREALRQIYDRYKVELLRLAVVLLGEVNTAEDIVHDIFVKFAGSGWGHGVGMCQFGVKGMADKGFDFLSILQYYYRGCEFLQIY